MEIGLSFLIVSTISIVVLSVMIILVISTLFEQINNDDNYQNIKCEPIQIKYQEIADNNISNLN